MNKEEQRIKEMTTTKYFHLQPKNFIYKEIRDGKKVRLWNCLCDCGKTVEREESTIIRGSTKSCGCMHPRKNSGKNRNSFKGYEELNGQYICQLKTKAKQRNLEWSEELTPEYLWELFLKQDRKCKLSRLELNFESCRNKQNGAEQTASLDRKDSTKGYTKENVQWIHKDVNKMKNNFSERRLLEIVKLVINKRIKAQENQFQIWP